MKDLTIKWVRSLMVLLAVTALFSTSCSKDDDNNGTLPDYVGKWSSIAPISTGEGEEVHKDIMTLTKNTFEDIIQTPIPGDKWVNTFIFKGTISVAGNKMNVHVSEIGVSSVDPLSGEFTGSMTNYKEGSLLFEAIIAQSGQEKDFQSEFNVSDTKLTLKTDSNDDGDYNDENETIEYTRL